MNTLEAAAELFGALAEPARLRILIELKRNELSIAELLGITAMKQVNTWKHLQLLERLILLC